MSNRRNDQPTGDDRMAAVQCFRAYIAEIDRTNSSDANNGSDGTSAKLEPTLMHLRAAAAGNAASWSNSRYPGETESDHVA